METKRVADAKRDRTRRPYMWDERDYKLWCKIQGLPSYGLLPGPGNDRMVSLNQVIEAMEKQAILRDLHKRGGSDGD